MSTTKDAPDLQLDFVEIVAPRLWMSTGYKNDYVGNSKPSAALDVDNPLSGWYDLGTIASVKVPLTKDVFEIKKGLPKTSRKMWEIDREAQITFNTTDLSPYVEALINGQTIYNTVTATPFTVASLMNNTRKSTVLSGNPDFADNDLVVCASPTAASLESSYNLAMVESLTGSLIVMADIGFPISMAHSDKLKKVKVVEFIDKMGADTVRSAMLFWDTYVDSSGNKKIQHVLYYPKLRNFSGVEIDTKDSAEPYDMSITLTAQAVNLTLGDGTTGYNFYKKWILAY